MIDALTVNRSEDDSKSVMTGMKSGSPMKLGGGISDIIGFSGNIHDLVASTGINKT